MPLVTIKSKPDHIRQSRSGRVAEHLRKEILAGRYAPETLLPGRRTLADAYNVSLPTVEQAVKALVQEGLLRAENGRGTFVASRTTEPPTSEMRQVAATIGIISSSKSVHADGSTDDNLWNNTIIHSLERLVATGGGSSCYANLVGWQGDDADAALAARRLIENGCSGIALVLSRGGSIYLRSLPDLCALGLPIVYVGGSASRLPITQVHYDDRDAGMHAAMHLLDQGASSLAYISPFTIFWVEARLQGALEAVDFRNADRSILSVYKGQNEVQETTDATQERYAYDFAKDLIARGFRADGVLAANDSIGYGFVRAADEAGMKMGQDYMIVGFDDDPRSREIGLSSMRPPLESMAEETSRLLSAMLAGRRSNQRVCLHCDLIARNSTILVKEKTDEVTK